MSPEKQSLIAHLVVIAKLTLLKPETMAISAMLHGIIGAAIIGKDAELALSMEDTIKSFKAAVEAELAKAEAEETKNTPDPDADFFDKNEIIS